MKIKRQYSSNRIRLFIALAILLLLCLGAGGAFYVWSKNNARLDQRPVNSTNYGPATSDQKKNGDNIKANNTRSTTDSKSTLSGSDQPPAPTPIAGSSKKSVQVSFTSANQNGSTFQTRIQIDTVVNTGTCTLTLSKPGSADVVKTAGVQPLASTSTCQGFDIPTSELSSGTWHMNLSYDSSDFTGVAQKDITIN